MMASRVHMVVIISVTYFWGKKSRQRKRVSILLPVTFLYARLLYSLSRRK